MTNDEHNLVVGALDSLGVALADHGHEWTEGERCIYETAIQVVQKRGVDIGKFNIRPWRDNSLWIENEDGEGMQVWHDQLEAVIQKFWDQHF